MCHPRGQGQLKDLREQLVELKSLADEGLISSDEYEQRRQLILRSPSPVGPDVPMPGGGLLSAGTRLAASSAATTTGLLAAGQRIGGCQLVRPLGEGAMGVVWEAEQSRLGRRVAIKILHRQWAISESIRERILREAQALGQIRHSRVINIHDCIESDGTIALILELAEGGSLADRIAESAPLAWQQSCIHMDGMLRGLGAMHRAGLIHRDVKPHNVLFARDDNGDWATKITDLGIAHHQENTRLTGMHQSLGTLEYMSPEQIRGHEVDARTDIYACGVVLYEMLTGRVPFSGSDSKRVWPCQRTASARTLSSEVPN